uniref:Uncharacterized protein n=1 Tax=Romanomermis culicivorax TaxID=13658 RepID=A0A915IEP8_ROMCU
MVPRDIQQSQLRGTLTLNLHHHGQPIHKPTPYKDSAKQKTQQQEKVKHPEACKTRMMDEPHAQHTTMPSTSRKECGKMLSEWTIGWYDSTAKSHDDEELGYSYNVG